MTIEDMVELVVQTVIREVGPVGLIARVEISRTVRAAVYFDEDDGDWDDDDDDDDEPDEPVGPPPAAPEQKPDLYALLNLKSPAPV